MTDKFRAFEDWLLANGAKFPKLALKVLSIPNRLSLWSSISLEQDYGQDVRGCISTEVIQEDEVVVEIPLKCLITVEMGKETEIGQLILQAGIDLDAPKVNELEEDRILC